MKSKNHFVITLITTYLAIYIALFGFSGCAAQAYTAEIYESDVEINQFPVGVELKSSVCIFGHDYDIDWFYSKISTHTNERIDKYHVVGEEKSTVAFDKNGDIVEFSLLGHISSYIFAFDSMYSLQMALEAELGDLADFSVYNDFSVEAQNDDGLIFITWQVVRDLPCDICVHLVVEIDGTIVSFSKTNACPDHLTKRFVTEKERDELLFKELRNKHSERNIESISIESEMLSLYKGEDALIYTVKSVDQDGFSYLDIVVIH